MIESTLNKVVFTIDGSRTFPFPYKFFEKRELQVFIGDGTDKGRQLQYGEEYTIEDKLDYDDGANVYLLLNLDEVKGKTLIVTRILPIVQSTSLPEKGKLPSEAIENQLDKIVMVLQQLSEALERCARLPETSSGTDAISYLGELLNSCEKSAVSSTAAAQRAEEILAEIGADSSVAAASVSVHNMNPDAHEGHLLNLAGGTMRGILRTAVADFFFRTVSDSHICFCGGKSFDEGASLLLLGQDVVSQWDTPGMFKIRAKAKDANGNPVDAIFLGTPDGFMSFKGRPVAFFVDGVGADGSGNVHLNALPKSGGQMTTTRAMSRNVDDSFLGLYGGTDENGAHLFLCGASHTDLPSVFQLIAQTSDAAVVLQGGPDGNLTWQEKDITLGYPDYSRGVVVTHEQIVNIYVAPEDGWFSCEINNGGQLFINDNWVSGGYYDMNVMVPVKDGDKIYGTNRTIGNTFGCRFFPIKRGV